MTKEERATKAKEIYNAGLKAMDNDSIVIVISCNSDLKDLVTAANINADEITKIFKYMISAKENNAVSSHQFTRE